MAEEDRGGRRSGDVDGLLDGAERVGPVGAVTDAGPRRGDAEVVGDDGRLLCKGSFIYYNKP